MLISSKNSDFMTMLIRSKIQRDKHYIQSYIYQTIISIEKYAFWHVLQKALSYICNLNQAYLINGNLCEYISYIHIDQLLTKFLFKLKCMSHEHQLLWIPYILSPITELFKVLQPTVVLQLLWSAHITNIKCQLIKP